MCFYVGYDALVIFFSYSQFFFFFCLLCFLRLPKDEKKTYLVPLEVAWTKSQKLKLNRKITIKGFIFLPLCLFCFLFSFSLLLLIME